ncbi:gamma carbonic anhydrase family protein [Azospirillum agricola]|uniref:gamma carbonic anhydrase family protein n=1 Tax=Azospirillum agricola TaxID=1720247 RepID=UPI000A0F1BAB|nr:phenylacetic acid degradation protein PaaY [Azospirillum agricola]SMH37787.1 phenylacetic acid degradation protein [Azospirillum lipoferum]
MPTYSYQGIVPVVDPTSFVHPAATLIGDVIVGPGCYLGPGASLRGDFGRIVVEGASSVQDNCTIHTSSGNDCLVGLGATVGHGAVLHGCRVGRHTLIGINAVVLDNAEIGEDCLVAALSLVRPDAVFPDRSLIAGNPARLLRTLAPEQITWRNDGARNDGGRNDGTRNGGESEYQRLARESFTDMVECRPLAAMEPDRPRIRANAIAVRLRGDTARERERRTATARQSENGEE